MPTSITSKLADGEYLNAWRQFKDENPKTYAAIGLAPVTGQIAAIPDYAEAMQRGSTADSMAAAASFIPGVKMGKKILSSSKIAAAAMLGEKAAKADQIKEAVTRQVDDLTSKPTLSSTNEYSKAWNES
jgi:hypothetical protein